MQCSAETVMVMTVFSFQIVYSHNCLYPCQECVGLMRKLSRCLLSPLITLAQYSQYSSITLYGNTSHHLYLIDTFINISISKNTKTILAYGKCFKGRLITEIQQKPLPFCPDISTLRLFNNGGGNSLMMFPYPV